MTVSMIAAKGTNNEIGGDNKLLWYIPSDLKFFKSCTMGKSIIMGRKTFESLPKALPGRKNIVLSRNADFDAIGATVVTSPEEAIRESETDEVFIIGGESIYKMFLPIADKLYITEVDITCNNADAFFPEFDASLYEKEEVGGGEENSLTFRHIVYTKE